jgi:Zn finger protein HypA/HybF involved in hydrogenase expression
MIINVFAFKRLSKIDIIKKKEREKMTEPPKIACPKCKHVWTKRVKTPQKCPNCGYKLQTNGGD